MPRTRKEGKAERPDAAAAARAPAASLSGTGREAATQPQPQPVRYQPAPARSFAAVLRGSYPPSIEVRTAAPPYVPAGGDPTQLQHQQQQQLQLVKPDSAIPAPDSSRALRCPRRPGKGGIGRRCMVKANHFLANLPDKDLHQYDVAVVPEVASRGVNRAVPEVASPGVNRAVIRELISVYNADMGNRLPVYDGRKNLYTAGPLPFQHKEFEVKLVDDAKSSTMAKAPRERRFKVTIKFAARPDLDHLGEFLKGKQAHAPQEVLQVLDIVLRELPTTRYTPVGRSFYSPHLGRRRWSLGGGLEAWRGFYQSIRPTQMGLSLNIDMSATAFLESQPVVQFVEKHLGRALQDGPLTDVDRVEIKKVLRGIKVEVTHRGTMRRKYRVSGLTTQTTADLRFPVDQGFETKHVGDASQPLLLMDWNLLQDVGESHLLQR